MLFVYLVGALFCGTAALVEIAAEPEHVVVGASAVASAPLRGPGTLTLDGVALEIPGGHRWYRIDAAQPLGPLPVADSLVPWAVDPGSTLVEQAAYIKQPHLTRNYMCSGDTPKENPRAARVFLSATSRVRAGFVDAETSLRDLALRRLDVEQDDNHRVASTSVTPLTRDGSSCVEYEIAYAERLDRREQDAVLRRIRRGLLCAHASCEQLLFEVAVDYRFRPGKPLDNVDEDVAHVFESVHFTPPSSNPCERPPLK